MKHLLYSAVVYFLFLSVLSAQVEPPNWWVGFKNNQLQLMVHQEGIGDYTPSIDYTGVTIKKVHKAKSPNYLFIDLEIDKSTQPGTFEILFQPNKGKKISYSYELKKRKKAAEAYVGFKTSDAIYLITPDRFANGNPKNDSSSKLREQGTDRQKDDARHGGDIAGILANLDYIADMGFTAIWSSPLLINDMPQWSYHGYAMTDFYQVDPRFGSLEEYKNLSQKASEKGIKLIIDQVANHCGLEHGWIKDLPFDDWLNFQSVFEQNRNHWNDKTYPINNHARTTHQDLYAAQKDKIDFSDGWFVANMPDLNQKNPFLATYIIQNSIWWVETLDLGGIRQDTYPYPDKDFMTKWSAAIMNEYPNFSIVGEEWSVNPLLIAYWQRGAKNKDGYVSSLSSTMDFAMQKNIVEALNEPENWNTGLVKMYEGLANDFHYAQPEDLMLFLDNHDMDRVFTQLKHNIENTKMALSYMLVLPRIPQIYYGTEIGMENSKKPGNHGLIRTDFPGGWQGDSVNAFTQKGLSKEQKDLQNFTKKLLNFRKNSKAIHEGKTIHFKPEKGVYFLFRILEDEVVVHIINKNDKPITIDLERFNEIGLNGKQLKNVISGEKILWENSLNLNQKGSLILSTL